MKAAYWDPNNGQTLTSEIDTVEDVLALCKTVSKWRTARGLPTIELVHANGANLSLSFDGERAYLVWIDPLGDSFQSMGGSFATNLVFDYFGSWSEASAETVVAFADAIATIRAFMESGTPANNTVLFSPD